MKTILKLTRMSMSAAIAFSAVAGYIFYSGSVTWKTLAVLTGVMLLACSSTMLNQLQEKNRDALMSRTKDRPLPQGLISPALTLVLIIITGIAGWTVLYFLNNPLTAWLGLFNMLWYNAVYTPLKTRTAFVVIVGALTGAIPPVMGWTAAGGSLFDREIIFIASFMFLWQIPHFLLLLLKYKDDYRRAGFKSATTSMNDDQVKFVVFMWTIGTALISLFFPFFGIITGKWLTTAIIVLNIVLITFFFTASFSQRLHYNMGRAFGSLYLYQLAVLTILIFQALKPA